MSKKLLKDMLKKNEGRHLFGPFAHDSPICFAKLRPSLVRITADKRLRYASATSFIRKTLVAIGKFANKIHGFLYL